MLVRRRVAGNRFGVPGDDESPQEPRIASTVVEPVRPMPARDALLVARIDRTHRPAG